jgi:pimeloyl-ACP methyl ester carboxylesterase
MTPLAHRPARLRAALAAALVAAATLPGCAVFRKMDLQQIHQESAHRQGRNPVIFLHGFLGAKLEHARSGRSVWGRLRNLLSRGGRDGLALPIDQPELAQNRDGLVPYGIWDSVGGIDYYGPIVDALRDVGGYEEGDIEHPHPGETLYVFKYDWRRDNVETAGALGEAIDRIRAAHGRSDLKVDLIAHSMGGLVARYYVKYGAVDVLGSEPLPEPSYAGARHVDKVILIGTPNEGSMTAFRILHRGITRPLPPQVLFTMPAIYQLLPGRDARPFVDESGESLPIGLYDPDNWIQYGWSAFRPEVLAQIRRDLPRGGGQADARFQRLCEQMRSFLALSLERADRFRRALAQSGPREADVRFYAFGSDCIPTQVRTLLHRVGETWHLAFAPDEAPHADGRPEMPRDLFYAPGDGSVTLASLMCQEPTSDARPPAGLTFASTFFLCETHGFLPKNPIFQNNLFHVLAGVNGTRPEPQRPLATRHPPSGA